jgi:hypothetical protein
MYTLKKNNFQNKSIDMIFTFENYSLFILPMFDPNLVKMTSFTKPEGVLH